jgi:hypothetical protein
MRWVSGCIALSLGREFKMTIRQGCIGYRPRSQSGTVTKKKKKSSLSGHPVHTLLTIHAELPSKHVGFGNE